MGKRSRVLYVNGETLYAQIGSELCISDDSGGSWRGAGLKLSAGARACSRLHARLMRSGVHCVKVLKQERFLVVAKGAVSVYDKEAKDALGSFSIPRGSRPLFICEVAGGELFWGEYFGNPKRDEVRIYGSGDGARSWQVAYRFKEKTIRHVHGVFHDPYDNRIWITTGDEDHESAIWVTGDRFKSLEKVLGGTQQSRALQLLFTGDYVYFGTDTPFAKNQICRLDKGSGRVEELQPVEGSIYWGCKVGKALFFSTAVEPSAVNASVFASIWGSPDGERWTQVARYRKDRWPIKYCQMGQIYLPQGNNTTGYLFYTPVATEDDQTFQRIAVVGLFD